MPLIPQTIAKLTAISLAIGCSITAAADTVLLDHFDDGVLDPAWQIEFENAVGWSFAEAGSELTVTSIQEAATDEWSDVHLVRPLDALGDFHMRAAIAWVSGTEEEVMQRLIVRLYDAEGTLIAQTYYSDAWVMWRGSLGASIQDGSFWYTGEHWTPFNGSTVMEIGRTGSDVTIWFDGVEVVAGVSDLPVAQVRIEFGFFPYAPNGNVVSLFGVESIDFIEITTPDAGLPGDFNGNGTVGVEDLLQLLAAWGACDDCIEDLDDDGQVGTGDLLMLLGFWG